MKCFYHNDADGKCAGFWVHHRAYLAPHNGMFCQLYDYQCQHGLSIEDKIKAAKKLTEENSNA